MFNTWYAVSVAFLLPYVLWSNCLAGEPAVTPTWESVTQLAPGGRFDALVYMGNGVVIVGNRERHPGGVFRSHDYGQTWKELGRPINRGILNLLRLDEQTLLASTVDGHIWKSSDQGNTWTDRGQICSHPIYSMVRTADGSILATEFDDDHGGRIHKSIDHGESWKQSEVISRGALYRLQSVRDGIIVNGLAGHLYKSIDNGETWKDMGKLSSAPLYAVETLPGGVALLGDAEGRIFRSEDDGNTWHMVHHVKDALDDFVYLEDGIVFLSSYEGKKHLYRSSDAGLTWEDIGPTPDGDVLDHAILLDDIQPRIAIGGTKDGRIIRATTMPITSTPIVSQLVDPVYLRGVEDVHLDGDYAYLPCREGRRLTICSVKDPANPKVISSFTHSQLDDAAGFAINGNTLYLASQNNHRLLVLDATDKSAVRLLGSVLIGEPGRGVLYKVAYRNGHCYVTHLSEKKLFVVNVDDPTQPIVVGSVAVTTEDDGPFSVLLLGDYALVGTIFGRRNRLAVVDVKDPTEPRLITQVLDSAMGHVSGEVTGDLYFAVNWDRNAFLVIDVADAANPKLKAKLMDERLGHPNRCVVSGDRAYLPMVQGDGVAVVDIADPMKPRYLTSIRDPILKKTYGVAVRGDLLFVGSREGNSLVILDRRKLERRVSHP